MTVGWETIRFGALVRMLSGGTPSKARPEFWDGDIPWVSCKDMKVDRIRDSEDHVSAIGAENGTRRVPPGTVLFVVRGMILAKEFPVAITTREVTFNQDLKALECVGPVSNEFIYYWLKANTHEILGAADEAAHGTKRLQSDRLEQLAVRLPPPAIQDRIVEVLSAYDDLIENNTKRMNILREMAHSLYREWFVNFRFPGYTAVKMINSPIGKVPEGWHVDRLDSALVLQRGFDLPVGDRKPGSVPVYAATGCVGTHDEAKVAAPGVLTGRSGSLGKVLIVFDDFWPLNTALWVKELKGIGPLYAYFLLSNVDLHALDGGAAVPTLNRNHVHALNVAKPPSALLQEFEDSVFPMLLGVDRLEKINRCLASQRDLVLPKLVSGEIAVDKQDDAKSQVAHEKQSRVSELITADST